MTIGGCILDDNHSDHWGVPSGRYQTHRVVDFESNLVEITKHHFRSPNIFQIRDSGPLHPAPKESIHFVSQ